MRALPLLAAAFTTSPPVPQHQRPLVRKRDDADDETPGHRGKAPLSQNAVRGIMNLGISDRRTERGDRNYHSLGIRQDASQYGAQVGVCQIRERDVPQVFERAAQVQVSAHGFPPRFSQYW